MDAISRWGIDLIMVLQRASPLLDGTMKTLSFLGEESFFLLLIPFLYWCVDAAWGMRALGVLVLSDFTNGLLKGAFHAPRPYWIDPRVNALSAEASYGIPSGHAQNAAALWGLLARAANKTWAWAAALILVLAISLSRVYLGVHFPHDVVAGWIVGAVVLAAWLWAEPRVGSWLKPRSLVVQVGAALALSALMLGMTLAVRAAVAGVADPPSWETQAASAAPPRAGRPATDPRNMDGLFVILGVVFGAGAGFALMRRYTPFDPRGPWWKRLVRLTVGLAVLVGLRVALGAIFPYEPPAVAMLFRYIRYAVMGLWMIWLAPWVFTRVGLADMPAGWLPRR